MRVFCKRAALETRFGDIDPAAVHRVPGNCPPLTSDPAFSIRGALNEANVDAPFVNQGTAPTSGITFANGTAKWPRNV
jgi:hypothetical protein